MSIESLSAKELYEKGKELESEGKHKEALQYYIHAQKKNPRLEYVYTSMGNAYVALKQVENAIKAYKKSIDIADNKQAYFNLGNLYFHLKMYNKAAQHLGVAERRGYQDAQTYLLLGKSLFHNKEFDEALRIVTKGYDKTQNPKLKEVRDKLKVKKKELTEKFPGINVLKKKIQANPKQLKNYNELAIHYGKMNDHKSAEEVLKQALRNNQDKLAAYSNMAAFYFNVTRYKQAAEILERGIRVNPDEISNANLNLHMNLAQAYLKLDEKKKAKKVLEKVLKLNPPKKEYIQKMLDGI